MDDIHNKKRLLCQQQQKKYNSTTRRCVKHCKPGQIRNAKFRCISGKNKTQTKKRGVLSEHEKRLLCQQQQKEYNSTTRRCVKHCKPGQIRNAKFRCISGKNKTTEPSSLTLPILSNVSSPQEEEKLFGFIHELHEKGKDYETQGIQYNSSGLMSNLMTLYLLNKYQLNCFIQQKGAPGRAFTFNVGTNPVFNMDEMKHLNNISHFIYQVLRCIKNIKEGVDVIFIPVGIQANNLLHHNMLIYRKTLGLLEHYEPLGTVVKYKKAQLLLAEIVKIMNSANKKHNYKYYDKDIEYVEPLHECPIQYAKGFQKVEQELVSTLPNHILQRESRVGFCIMWSFLIAELAILNPTLRNYELINTIYDKLYANEQNIPLFLRNTIRGYIHFMYEYVSEYLIQNYNIRIDFKHTIPDEILQDTIKVITFDNFIKYNKTTMKTYFKNPGSITLSL
jgi:hypothetical protein